MAYSMAGLIALFVTLIVNFDVFVTYKGTKDLIPARNYYRVFLIALCSYFITDGIWGILDHYHHIVGLYIDTYVYFVAMALSVFMWCRYTVEYLGKKNHFSNLLIIFGWMFITAQIILLIINTIVPIFFKFDEAGKYITGYGRHVSLIVQGLIFLGVSIYTWIFWGKSKDDRKHKHLAIALCSTAMVILCIFQFFFPLLPLYSIGFLAGSCLLHTFVVEAGKRDYRKTLEKVVQEDKKHQEELLRAQLLVLTDPLTGVRSKHAFIEIEAEYDARIGYGNQRDFAMVVFDLNDLKVINDHYGHDVGDNYIKESTKIISDVYKNSSIFRVGGDEFAAILELDDYTNRDALFRKFNDLIDKNLVNGGPVVAAGMSEYNKYKDFSMTTVFIRADRLMYDRKKELKLTADEGRVLYNPHHPEKGIDDKKD